MDLHLSAQCVTPCKIVLSAECDSAFLADDLFHCSTLSTVKLGPDWSTYQTWSEFATTVLPLTATDWGDIWWDHISRSSCLLSLKISFPVRSRRARCDPQLNINWGLWCDVSFLSDSWGDPACGQARPASHLTTTSTSCLLPAWCNYWAHDLLHTPRQHVVLLQTRAGEWRVVTVIVSPSHHVL